MSNNEAFDDSVVEAINDYQASNDLNVDGIVTGDTARSLTEDLREKIENNDTQLEAAIEALK